MNQQICVSSCPAGTYPDADTRVCRGCSSNCFSCLGSSFCYSCKAGYDLKNGICISSIAKCSGNQVKYNGICLDICPIGTCAKNGYCERSCSAQTYFYNQGCYKTCPTASRTDDACFDFCPNGYTLVNGVCKNNVQQCQSGQFFNSQNSICEQCQYPCSECQLTPSYCTACTTGLSLSLNRCISQGGCGSGKYKSLSGSCDTCTVKCAECISQTECSSCSSGYQFNGFDCVISSIQLKPLTLNVKTVSKRGSTVFVTIRLNIIPNGLTETQKSKFFYVLLNKGDTSQYVNQWISTSSSN